MIILTKISKTSTIWSNISIAFLFFGNVCFMLFSILGYNLVLFDDKTLDLFVIKLSKKE